MTKDTQDFLDRLVDAIMEPPKAFHFATPRKGRKIIGEIPENLRGPLELFHILDRTRPRKSRFRRKVKKVVADAVRDSFPKLAKSNVTNFKFLRKFIGVTKDWKVFRKART